MYRPTVRYDDCYKEYVDELFHSTHLDRNQIHRLALFLLGFTHEGKEILEHFKKTDVTLPSPPWKDIGDYGVWLESTWKTREKEGTSDEDVPPNVGNRYPIRKEGRHDNKGRVGTGSNMDRSERKEKGLQRAVRTTKGNGGTITFILD